MNRAFYHKNRFYFLVGTILLVGLLVVISFSPPSFLTGRSDGSIAMCKPYNFPESILGDNSSKPTSPVHVHLEPQQLAPLGGTIKLCLTVLSEVDANAECFFEVPKGVALIDGQSKLNADLTKNVPQTFEIQVRLSELGKQEFMAGATIFKDGRRLGNFALLSLEVSSTKTEILQESSSSSPSGDQQTQPLP